MRFDRITTTNEITKSGIASPSQERVGAHGEGSHTHDGRGHGVQPEAFLGKSLEPGQMLENRDPGSKQERVRWTGAVGRLVDLERVDSDERDLFLREKLGGRPGQIRMTFPVPRSAPMPVPARVKQDRAAAQFPSRQSSVSDRTALSDSQIDA